MSTKRIRWIVALMAVGLLGLVGFQLYWIRTALHLQQEQFDYRVTDALQEVVRTLERQEIRYLATQRLRAQDQQQRLMAIARPGATPAPPTTLRPKRNAATKPAERLARRERSDRPQRTGRLSPTTLVPPSDVLHPVAPTLTAEQVVIVEQFFRQQEELMAVGDWQTQLEQQQYFDQWIDQVLAEQLAQMNHQRAVAPYAANVRRSDSLQKVRAAQRRQRSEAARRPGNVVAPINRPSAGNVVNGSATVSAGPANRPPAGSRPADSAQAQMVKDVLKGLLLSDRPIEERVDRQTLDTLLRQALQERGITIPFDYGVQTRSRKAVTPAVPGAPTSLLFASRLVAAADLEQRGYKAALFPNNLLETGNYVYLYFPDRQQFIWSRMGMTLAGSAVLILVIMACFYIAISTIVRQKKLADIKNDFINNMTHEFKTPISTISLAVEMAQEQLRNTMTPATTLPDAATPPRLSRYMNIIRDETRRLGAHVEKVLQMALLDRGEVKLKLTTVNIHNVVENVLNSIGLQIEQRQGEVELDFGADRELVEADEVHLTNILYNLVDNAIKYSPDRPHITLRTQSLPDGISLSVADRGLGMTSEQQSRIFEKFYRVPTGNRHDVKGFGLGLSYVKKMVEEHHGRITVESLPGRGSTFDVFIPYKQPQ